MAAQTQDARVILQPTQQEAPPQTNVFAEGAQTLAQTGALAGQESRQQENMAGRYGQMASQYFSRAINVASAGFDKILFEYNKIAEENGARDATGIIKRDTATGQLIPPSDFYPPGIRSRAYGESYRKNAEAAYRQSAETEYQDYASVKMQEHSGDPAAFKVAMNTKRQAMMSGLDERFAPFLGLRFEQIDSRATSQIAVRLQSETNQVNKQAAEEALASLNSETARLGDFATNNFQPGELNQHGQDLLANQSILAQKWADYETRARTAGVSQAQIDKNKAELGFNAWLHSAVSMARRGNFHDGKGDVDPDAVAAARKEAVYLGDQFPGKEKIVTGAINGGIDFALQQSQLHAQGVVYRDNKMVDPKVREITRRALEVQALPADQWEQKQALTEQLQRDTIGILGNSSISDSAAMKLAGAYQQAGAISRGALQDSFTNRITSLVNTVNSVEPEVKAEHKAAAMAELQTIRDDSALAQHITPGQRNVIQGGIDSYVKGNIAGDFTQMSAAAAQGIPSPPQLRSYVQGLIDNGAGSAGHPISLANLMALEKTGVDAYNAKQQESALARDHKAVTDAGGDPTPDQIEARKKRQPFKLDDGRLSYDPTANPQDLAKFTAEYRDTKILPDMVKQAATTMKRTENQAEMQGWIDTHRVMFEVEAERFKRRTGKEMPAEIGNARIAAILGEEPAGYLAFAKKWGAKAAYDVMLADATSQSKSGQAGGPSGTLPNLLDAALDNISGKAVQTSAGMSVFAKLLDGRGLWGKPWRDTREERGAEALITPPPSGTVDADGTPTQRQVTGSITVAPALRSHLKEGATIYLAQSGKAIRDQRGNASAEEFAMNVQLEKAKEAGLVEMVVDENGNGSYGFKTFGTHLSEKLGLRQKMTPDAETAAVDNIIQQERIRTGASGTDYDPSTAKAVGYMDQNGNLTWHVSVSDRNDIPVTQMQINKDDPRIGAEAMAVQKAAFISLRSAGFQGDGAATIKASGALMRFKQSIDDHLFREGRIQTIIQNASNRNLSGDTSGMNPQDLDDIRNFQVTLQKELQRLQPELGPNGPNAEKVLKEMLKTPEAAGPSGSAILALLEGFGAGQRRPVRTGPSRIGTEERRPPVQTYPAGGPR